MSLSRRDDQIESLFLHLSGIFEIICDRCGKRDLADEIDQVSAADTFYDWGWRYLNHNTLCKACAKMERKK